MAGRIEQTLAALGLSIPTPVAPIANYVGYVVTPGLVMLSGQLPVIDGTVAIVGTLGDTLTVEEGQRAARQCFLNVLAQLRAACAGDLDRVTRIVHLRGFIAAAPVVRAARDRDERRVRPRRRRVRRSRAACQDNGRGRRRCRPGRRWRSRRVAQIA